MLKHIKVRLMLLIKELRNFYKHKRISNVSTTKKLLETMSFDYMKEKYENINNYEKEED